MGGQVVKADLVNPPGINGGFSAPYRIRNPTLIQHGIGGVRQLFFWQPQKEGGFD